MSNSILTKYKQRTKSVEADIDELRNRLQELDPAAVSGAAPLSTYFEPAYDDARTAPPQDDSLSVWDILRFLRQGWWIIALTTLMALTMALVAVYFATPLYRASAQIILSPNPEMEGSQAAYIQSALEKRFILSTIAELLDSDRIYNETGATLQLPDDVLESYERSTVVLPETTILEHSVTGPDSQVAALLANTIGQRTIEFTKGKYQAYDAAFLNLAVSSTEPVSPQPVQNISLALGLGFILGLLLAIARGFMASEKGFDLPWSPAPSGPVPTVEQRRSALSQVQEALVRSPAYPLSLALVQLDMPSGSEPLSTSVEQRLQQQAAALLRRELRGKDLVVRWDDHTIVVLLPDVPGNKARRALDHMHNLLVDSLEYEYEGSLLHPHPRIGVTERQGDEPAPILIEQAELALEQSYQSGRPAELFSPMPHAAWPA